MCSRVFRLLLLLGGMVVVVGSAAAQPEGVDRRFKAANEAYDQGRYARAVKLYRAVLDTGYTSGALYYNLGNAYVRLDRLGQGIRYYEKARRLRPGDPRVHHNLEQARRRAGVYPERLGRTPLWGLGGLVRGWSPLALFVAGGLLLCGGLIVAVVWTGTDPDKPESTWDVQSRPLVWGPVAAGLLLVGVALGTSYVQSLDRRAVVVTDRVPLRAAPAPEAPSDTTLSEGVLLEVHTRHAQWHEVRLADGTTGWVPVRALGEV